MQEQQLVVHVLAGKVQGISVRPDGWKTEYFQRHDKQTKPEFALKTEPERRSAYADMLLSPVMHTDCTNARENGKSCQVYVCATPDGKALYLSMDVQQSLFRRNRNARMLPS